MKKILIAMAFLCMGFFSAQAMEESDYLADQGTQRVKDLTCYGYMSNKAFALSEVTVERVLDTRFDAELAANEYTTNAKKFLQGTIVGVVGLYGDKETLYDALQRSTPSGVLEVDVTVAGFNAALIPTEYHISEAVSAVYETISTSSVK